MRAADMQNASRYADYINEQRPGLNLRQVNSMESLELELENSFGSGASHTRILFCDTRRSNCFFMEFHHPPDAPVTAIAFNHAGIAPQGIFQMTFMNFRSQIANFKRFKDIFFLQVDLFKQANKSDTVMFAAHSALVAPEHAEDFAKLHALALAGTKYISDEGRYRHPIKPQLFPDAFYKYEQIRYGTPPEVMKFPGNYLPILDFRQQLLRGVMAMSHTQT